MQTYKGLPLLDCTPHFENVEHGQLDDVTLKAVGIGPVTPWKPTTMLKRTLKLTFRFFSQGEWRGFRDFVAARGGIVESFWLPIWITDYPMTSFITSPPFITGAKIQPIGLANYFALGNQFGYCALIRPQNVGSIIEPHQILSVTPDGNFEDLSFLETVDPNFNATRSILCGLIVARFATSQIDYKFESDGVIEAEVDFDECPKEYP